MFLGTGQDRTGQDRIMLGWDGTGQDRTRQVGRTGGDKTWDGTGQDRT